MRWLLLMAVCLTVSACGQKGDLYLPEAEEGKAGLAIKEAGRDEIHQDARPGQ